MPNYRKIGLNYLIICHFQSTFDVFSVIIDLSIYGGFFMFNLVDEKDKYLIACKSHE